jgi:molecular chaperone HtpG
MTTETAPEEFKFQAEIAQLLHLLSHSLYQNKEIAIRELVSNASDAIDRFRHVTLTDSDQNADDLGIFLESDSEKKTLTIRDNGVGMTHDELVTNLGTIAHSGSVEFLSKLAESDSKGDVSLIGQFGVGFYSAFMLAAQVEVLTRSYQEESGWKWTSDGSGKFTIEAEDGLERGTQIRLRLKEDMGEFAQTFRLKHILTEYSTFVPYPIKLEGEHVNDQKPIWVEPKSQVTDEQYKGFYHYLSKRSHEDPLWHLHLTADSPFQFHTVLFCPPTNMELMGFGKAEHGLSLCARRILVQNNSRELLPEYLRFLHGLVDSADLPLNVSRQALQDNSVFRKIRNVLTKRVLSHLNKMGTDSADEYRKFYEQFGPVLREGVASDFENRDALGKLLRFKSSHGDDRAAQISLTDYVGRMSEEQTQIYYHTGPDLKSLERSPNMEAFTSRGVEVLYLTDPVDEFVLNHLGQFEEKELVSIDSAEVKLPDAAKKDEADDESSDEKKDESASPAGFDRVVELIKEDLGDKVEDVRKSDRLTSSACCLVSPEGAPSAQLQKVLAQASDEFTGFKRVFELNPTHPLLARLCELSANSEHDAFVKSCGSQLFTNAMLMEGLVPDVHSTTDRITGFMEELAGARSPIVGA